MDLANFGIKVKFEPITQKNSLKVKLAFQGPSYEGTERTLTVLRVEISLREKILLESETKEIFPGYPDLQPYLIKVMNLEEIMAEKIRTIITRDKARDIFDVRFLLNKRININEKLVNEKLKLYNLTYSKKMLLEKLSGMEKVWHNELSQLMEKIPEFKIVVMEIKEKM